VAGAGGSVGVAAGAQAASTRLAAINAVRTKLKRFIFILSFCD
jgi:hypothetical protein